VIAQTDDDFEKSSYETRATSPVTESINWSRAYFAGVFRGFDGLPPLSHRYGRVAHAGATDEKANGARKQITYRLRSDAAPHQTVAKTDRELPGRATHKEAKRNPSPRLVLPRSRMG
jgi:hypothetical protein